MLLSNTGTSSHSERPLELCLQGRPDAFEVGVAVSSVWGQQEHQLPFPWLSAALLITESVCLLILYKPLEALGSAPVQGTWGC